ncbi:MAG: START-like domain-containing protein [Fluviicola sp.]|jgi:uncharacterized protein YndB with AHSA1/START domain
MTKKEKFELEYVLKTSPKVLEKLISTPDGLSEWFADDVMVREDLYTFHWDGSDEQARLLGKNYGDHIKWQWLYDEEDELDTFFEMRYTIDPMTKAVIFRITDFAEPEERDEIVRLWETQITNLRRVIGA